MKDARFETILREAEAFVCYPETHIKDEDKKAADLCAQFALRCLDARGPIDMIIHCPKCGVQHVDAPEPDICECGCDVECHKENGECYGKAVTIKPGPRTVHCPCTGFKIAWNNPPHKSHLCHGCGIVWRPANIYTNGVESLASRGVRDTWPG